MPQKILVVGATGLLGRPVAHRLLADGFQVRVLARSPDKARQMLGEGFEIVQGDVTRPQTLDRTVEGCYGVHVSLRGGFGAEEAEQIEHHGTINVVRAAGTGGVRRLTYLSGAGSFEENKWFPSVRAKLAAEAAIRASGVPFTIFCPTHFMESLPLYVRRGRAMILGRQPHGLHFVAARDFARMVSRSFSVPEAAGKRLYVFGPEAMTMRAALEAYGGAQTPRVKVSSAPIWLVSLFGTVTRKAEAIFAADLFRFFSLTGERGDPTQANELLGAPTTTLVDWLVMGASDPGTRLRAVLPSGYLDRRSAD
ncbi:MAG: SDR family NAD(P)-dependent oxidoreductase [Acidobacteria bacterium]|nr:SDR family NAD(P)-dependent oxidoreductase [Acidobacteriota bacterium]